MELIQHAQATPIKVIGVAVVTAPEIQAQVIIRGASRRGGQPITLDYYYEKRAADLQHRVISNKSIVILASYDTVRQPANSLPFFSLVCNFFQRPGFIRVWLPKELTMTVPAALTPYNKDQSEKGRKK
jgi:hypothetical protein